MISPFSLSLPMAETHNKTHKSKPKSYIFLCCFGSSSQQTSNMDSDHNSTPKMSWFLWRSIRNAKSATKTVPLDVSLSDHKHRADQVRSTNMMPKSESKSKSNSVNSQTPAANLEQPSQTPPMLPVKPNQTPPPTRHKHRPQQSHANNQGNRNLSRRVASPEKNTCKQSSSSPAMSNSVSLPTSKRQVRRLSFMSKQTQTTLSQPIRWEKANRYDDPVVGISVVLVTLVIMILWGRLCAIFCTSAWLYFIPRFRASTEEYRTKNSNIYSTNLDLDSEIYKKKVILEGLLERNHRRTL